MAQPIVKPILELSQEDLDGCTSLYAVRVRTRVDLGGWAKTQITVDGKKYDIGIKKLPVRNLEEVVNWSTSCNAEECIYYVLNASDSDINHVKETIETYAQTLGMRHVGSGTYEPMFCKIIQIQEVREKFKKAAPLQLGEMPRNVTVRDDTTAAEQLRRSQMGIGGSRHSHGSSGWRTSRRKDGEPSSPVYRLKRRANSNPRRTGGRKNRRRSAASRSRKNYRRS